jgi:very-short-patch-repair endonuclease
MDRRHRPREAPRPSRRPHPPHEARPKRGRQARTDAGHDTNAAKLLPAAGTGRTRSDLEQDFLTFLRKHDLPLPQLNQDIEGFEVDCVWPTHRLIVELDGGAAHGTPHAFEADRARDETLVAAGWSVIRVTPSRLAGGAMALAANLCQLLS